MLRTPAFRFFSTLLLCCLFTAAKAQPLLPDMASMMEKGMNVVTWTAQYDGIKSIAVQRSADSIYNYVTIGYVKNLKKGIQGFIDGHPLPGNNWYRLYIVFNSDLTWYSNRVNMPVDSATLAKQTHVLPPNDSLQKLLNSLSLTNAIADPSSISAYTYVKSQYVFTNPFTGHINMELPDFKNHQYAIKFFDQKNKQILEVPRVPESPVVIDKRNFQRKGVYKFELYKDKQKMETGYITIY